MTYMVEAEGAARRKAPEKECWNLEVAQGQVQVSGNPPLKEQSLHQRWLADTEVKPTSEI